MPSKLLANRLYNQRLIKPVFKTPLEVVTWFGAVQAQDYGGAAWAVGQRLEQAIEADIHQALADGSIIRTHALRPTWHFVAPVDARWMLELTAPRVKALMNYNQAQVGLDKDIFLRSNKVFAKALEGGKHLTRTELATALKQAGFKNVEPQVGFMTGQAELDRVICSGPRKGKQFTYALFDERVPATKPKPREEALAELALRYFTSHGPATLPDYAWWSGLTATDAKAGLEAVKGQLLSEEIEGQTYWWAKSAKTSTGKPPTALLLPNYDEYIVAYTDRTSLYDGAHDGKLDSRGNVLFNHTLIADGQIAGTWKRTLKSKSVVVEFNPFIELTKAQQKAFEAEAERYAAFVGLALDLK